MPLHNLATVMAPNVFRPFDITANDLIFAGHLVECLKLMIMNYEYIFDVEDSQLSSSGGTNSKEKVEKFEIEY